MSNEHKADPGQYTVSYRSMDAFIAVCFMAAASVVMWDSQRVGTAWVSDGPQAGYFPFYIGLIMFISGLGVLLQAFLTKKPNLATFVEKGQLWSVLRVLIPAAIYVGLIPYLGLYVSAAIFIIVFMMWIGKYSILWAIPIAVGVPMFLFVLFEIWFLIPLPKGPVENALGF
jgi:putative tricarboxylic transport membrane protein